MESQSFSVRYDKVPCSSNESVNSDNKSSTIASSILLVHNLEIKIPCLIFHWISKCCLIPEFSFSMIFFEN